MAMMRAAILLVLSSLCAYAVGGLVLPNKVPSHPRLILRPSQDLIRIHNNIDKYPLAAELYRGLVQHADILIQHAKESTSDVRNLRDVGYTLGLMWQLTHNSSYSRAAIDVLVAASRDRDICGAYAIKDIHRHKCAMTLDLFPLQVLVEARKIVIQRLKRIALGQSVHKMWPLGIPTLSA